MNRRHFLQVGACSAAGVSVELHSATLISTGTELANWTGITVDRRAMGADWSAQPYRPGYSYVGVVRAVGDGVAGVAVGDRICGQGGHASAAMLEAARVAVVPAGLSDVQASFTTLLLTSEVSFSTAFVFA